MGVVGFDRLKRQCAKVWIRVQFSAPPPYFHKELVNMNKKQIINKRIEEHYNHIKNDYEVVGIFLQGSQNYSLDYEHSDIDTKAIVLPSFEDFCLNSKPVSKTLVLDNNEHIDVKDIRLMFDCFKKQNINFVEILFTEYKILNPKYEKLFENILINNEKIARYNNYQAVNCISGMAMEKFKALKHPYPATIEKIEKYGFDGKQIHHCLRLLEFIKRYLSGEKYSDCLISKQREYLLKVKKNEIYNVDEAYDICKETVDEIYNIKTEYMKNNDLVVDKEVEEIMQNVLLNVMKKNFVCELVKD